jgi:starch synthase
MRIAMVASECEPFAKTGGLADVVDALARALGELGHEVDVYLPRYRGVQTSSPLEALAVVVHMGADPRLDPRKAPTRYPVVVRTGQADGYRIRLVDYEPAFDRDGFYGDGSGDYPDNPGRFTLLGRAALETMRTELRPVDVIHGHDWQSGGAILSLRTRYANEPLVSRASAVLTCHNLAYHGWVPRDQSWQLDLPHTFGDEHGVDVLREAVRIADAVNTVSPTFAEESLTPDYGAGLDDVLRARANRYTGILNGIDTALWDPATDAALPAPYSVRDLAGKHDCRIDLCARHGLDAEGPLFGVIGRLDPQKGFDLVADAASELLADGARLIALGTGDDRLIGGLRRIARDRPDRVVVLERFDRDEARRIYAGSDLFLMPSRFEPSGQGQMIAMRYGTIPVVRRTGGLADTVVDADEDRAAGNGFVFGPAQPSALMEAARRAIAAYRDAERWHELQRRAMAKDFSWSRPARQYEALYRWTIDRALASRTL